MRLTGFECSKSTINNVYEKDVVFLSLNMFLMACFVNLLEVERTELANIIFKGAKRNHTEEL